MISESIYMSGEVRISALVSEHLLWDAFDQGPWQGTPRLVRLLSYLVLLHARDGFDTRSNVENVS